MVIRVLLFVFVLFSNSLASEKVYVKGPPLYYWQTNRFINIGDYLSLKLTERIVSGNVRVSQSKDPAKKFLAIGSVLPFARSNDIIWGTGMNGKKLDPKLFQFTSLDIRAVRGPMTREFIVSNFGIECPEVYGDPALLLPYFFPEFKKPVHPKLNYVIIPHYSDIPFFPKSLFPNAVYPTDPWREVIRKILDSQFVISSSLHGLVIAEAYHIPARYIRLSEKEPLFKYQDYYLGTGRTEFQFATSLREALEMGGEPPVECDLKRLYEAFPFDYFPGANFYNPFDS